MNKKRILFAIFLVTACTLFGQQGTASHVKDPAFPGGMPALIKYLTANMNYPAFTDKTDTPESAIVMHFMVMEDGSISDVRILREPAVGLGAEAARVIGKMPKWIPGQSDGKPVAMPVTLPINMHLGVQKN